MEWHAGNSLSQTVYTSLYVHYLGEINPDFMARRSMSLDSLRPQELITVVLRAATVSLLKSCDLSWRELSRGRVQEIEDWFAEKCDISLLEGVSVDFGIKKIDDSCQWIQNSLIGENEQNLLCDRLLLRKNILELLKLPHPLHTTELRTLVTRARHLLKRIRSQPVEPPRSDSPALLTFDPYISRRLSNFMPVRVMELPAQEGTWDALAHMLDGWDELGYLLDNPSISTWEIAGSLRIWSPAKQIHMAYIRSLIQSSVFDRNVVFGHYPLSWLVNRFFLENIGVSWDAFLECVGTDGNTVSALDLKEAERHISKLMIAHIRSQFYNPPRRRRYLAKSVLQWHKLYDQLLQLISHVSPADQEEKAIVECIPKAAMMQRLSASREVILSGFQQDLYASEEVPIAYWYLARVLDVHLACMDDVLGVTGEDWEGYDEMIFQSAFLIALEIMAIAMCAITFKHATLPFKRTSLNFVRRYKWAFEAEYDDCVPAVPLPDLRSFAPQVTELLQNEHFSPSQSFHLAEDIINDLVRSEKRGLASLWTADRLNFVRELSASCGRLEAATKHGIGAFDSTKLTWKDRIHPWFPDISI